VKKLRYAFIIVVGLLLYSVLLASSIRLIYRSSDRGQARLGFLAQPLEFLALTPSLIKQVMGPDEFMVRNSTIKDGFTYFKKPDTGTYPKVLVSFKDGKFSNKFDLYDINTGDVIKEWAPDNKSLYEKGYNEANPRKPPYAGSDLYFMHPLMTADSSLIFTSQLTSLIARIDKNSDLVWMKKDRQYHHSLEMDANGNIYSCTTPFKSAEYDFLPPDYADYRDHFIDDHITLLDAKSGDILFDKSVIDILAENGYGDLVISKGQIISDPIHLNDIQPALYDSPFWAKGDLLVSCRNLCVVFLYRPETDRIIWLKQGPWANQHDADFEGEDKIVVFGNDVIREESIIDPRVADVDLYFRKGKPHNEIYVYDFSRDSIMTPYHKLMKTENVQTDTSGRCDILPNGDIFVEETKNGRIIIGDSTTKKIEFVKRLDEGHVSWLFWSRIVN